MINALDFVETMNAALPKDVRIEGPLADGGQGRVYRGSVGHTRAAVKVYYPDQIETRIDREIQALQRLACPAIARLLWAGEVPVDARPLRVVATQLIDGRALDDVVQERALTPEEAGALLFDVADAIHHLWELRVVHRDLKPSNIIMSGGRAVVIDLGVARHVDRTPLTATGSTWGTLGYMSPEQTNCVRQLTCKSDLFALGIILLEALLRRHPTDRDQLRLLAARFSERLPEPADGHPLAPTVRLLLSPRATARPLPEAVMRQHVRFARRC